MAEGKGFEPLCKLPHAWFSRPARYDRFGTPPHVRQHYITILLYNHLMSRKWIETPQIENNSPLIEKVSDETRSRVRQEAVDKIEINPTHSVFPVTPAKLRRVLIDSKNSAVNSSALGSEKRAEALQNVTNEELIDRSKGYLYGKWLEGFSNDIELNEAGTAFIGSGVDESIFENSQVRTAAEVLFTNRKDRALMVLYTESVEITGRNNSDETEKILENEEDRKAIAGRVKDFIQSQDNILATWRKDNGGITAKKIDTADLFEAWWSAPNIQNLTAKFGENGKTYAKACLNEALAIADHKKDSADTYYDYTLPDTFVESLGGEIVAPIEVKAYSEEEIKIWTEDLKKLAEDMRSTPTLKTKSQVGDREMNLGLEPTAELRFIELMNFVRLGNENSESFKHYYEKLATTEPDESPIVLRFTEDISDQAIQELGKACEKLGFTNLVIQKLPFTREELGIGAQHFCKKNLDKLSDRKVAGYAGSPRDKKIFEALAQKETWN
jgi:hypothetical protein